MKRFIDIIFSLLLLFLLFPIIIIVMIMIKTTSKGTIVFKQKRYGVDGKIFNMFKFRTMHIDAPRDVATHNLMDATKYITPVGFFLRKSSLDEIPQLINVIKGEMSIVGPRPALPSQEDLIEMRIEACINSIKPGITGLAQINGRDHISIQKKVFYDKYYFENRSLLLDTKIFFVTIFKVLSASDIYDSE